LGVNGVTWGHPLMPETATARFVERHGPGMHSIALQVEDLAATYEHLEAAGVRMIPVNDRIAFSHPADTGGGFIEWFSDEHGIDPHFGASIPAPERSPLLRVDRMAFVGALVQSPNQLAHQLAGLCGRRATVR